MIIGVDPGKKPCFCQLGDDGSIIDIFTVGNNVEFPHGLLSLNLFELGFKIEDKVVCEIPHSVFGSSAKSNFSFGYSVGATIQSLYSFTDSVELVRPKAWQKVIWKPEDKVKGDTKATSLNAAKRILKSSWEDKNFIPKRGRVINHNYVDAFLIAYYKYLTL